MASRHSSPHPPTGKVPSTSQLPDGLSQFLYQHEHYTLPPAGEDRSQSRLAVEVDSSRVYFPGQEINAILSVPASTLSSLRELWCELRAKVYSSESAHIVLFARRATIQPEDEASHVEASFERLPDLDGRARWSLRYKLPADLPTDTLELLDTSRMRVRGDSIPLPPTFVGALTRSGGRHGPESNRIVYALRAGGEAVNAGSSAGAHAVAATSSKAAALIGAAIRPFTSKAGTAAAVTAQIGRLRARQPLFVLPYAPASTSAQYAHSPDADVDEADKRQGPWISKSSKSPLRSKDGKHELSLKVQMRSPIAIFPSDKVSAHVTFSLSGIGQRHATGAEDIHEQTRAFERNLRTSLYLRQVEECDFKSVNLLGGKNTSDGAFLSSIPVDVVWEEATAVAPMPVAEKGGRRFSTSTGYTEESTVDKHDSSAASEVDQSVLRYNGKGGSDAGSENGSPAPAWQRVWIRKAHISTRPGAALTPPFILPTLHAKYTLVLRVELGSDSSSSTGRVTEVDLPDWVAVTGVTQDMAADAAFTGKLVAGTRYQELEALNPASRRHA